MTIRIGVVGRIVSGDGVGEYVEVLDDSGETGGFLIVTFSDAQKESGEGYDNWVESFDQVEGYFKDRSWRVEWGTESDA